MKLCIMYKYAGVMEFPTLTSKGKHTPISFSMPSDDEIKAAVSEAKLSATEMLSSLGIELGTDIEPSCMDEAIYLMPNFTHHETEFLDIENYMAYENSEMDVEHAVNVLDDEDLVMDEVEELLNSSDGPKETSEADKLSDILIDDVSDDNGVYDASKIFPNCNDELKLTSTRVGKRHTFKVVDGKGVIKFIKKSSFLWMWTQGRHRLSSDRMRRFQQREYGKNVSKKKRKQ